jgi:hypothetical protein
LQAVFFGMRQYFLKKRVFIGGQNIFQKNIGPALRLHLGDKTTEQETTYYPCTCF